MDVSSAMHDSPYDYCIFSWMIIDDMLTNRNASNV